VEHRAGPVVFVAADRFAGGVVAVARPVDPASGEDGVHGRGWHVQPAGDLDRAQTLFPPQMHDLAHDRLRRPGRAAGCRLAIVFALGPFLQREQRELRRCCERG